jgi:hypothetical protein
MPRQRTSEVITATEVVITTETAKPPKTEKKRVQQPVGVTLSGFLNALDGIAGQESCVVFATT